MIACNLATLIDRYNEQRGLRSREKRLTQAKLARDTGIAATTVYRLYQNKCSRIDLSTLNTLCEFLGCEVSDLLFKAPNVPKPGKSAKDKKKRRAASVSAAKDSA